MSLLWLGIAILISVPLVVTLIVGGLYFYVRCRLLDNLLRIFQEKPLFIIPRGQPREGAEDIAFPGADGLTLRGCYLKTNADSRKGVILFGLEFGSSRWSCQSYCEPLLQSGYDVFAFEPRNQGDSEGQEGYDPLQWVTTYEVRDTQSAIRYLKSRDDADPKGIGFFGISKGANAGLLAAGKDRTIRCIATDGAFGTYSTMLPYMRKWVAVYSQKYLTQGLLPVWFYGMVAMAGLRKVQRARHVRFQHVETAMPRLKRPLLMIHGSDDSYIKTEMARDVFKRAAGPKAFWVVNGAKHNQAIHIAGPEYSERVVSFFNLHLAGLEPATVVPEPVEEAPAIGEAVATVPA